MAHKRDWLKNGGVQDALVVFVLGCALFFYSLKEHYGWFLAAGENHIAREWKLSAYLFPALIAVFLILLAVSLLFEGLLREKPADDTLPREKPASQKTSSSPNSAKLKPAVLVIILSIAYYFALKPLRFLPSTIIFLALLMFLLGERRVLRITIVSVLSALVIYAVFALALKVMLP
jgi:hypothetical protein